MGGEFDAEELDVEQSQASSSSSQYTTKSTESTKEDHNSDDVDNW